MSWIFLFCFCASPSPSPRVRYAHPVIEHVLLQKKSFCENVLHPLGFANNMLPLSLRGLKRKRSPKFASQKFFHIVLWCRPKRCISLGSIVAKLSDQVDYLLSSTEGKHPSDPPGEIFSLQFKSSILAYIFTKMHGTEISLKT